MSYSKFNLIVICIVLVSMSLGCDKNKTPTDPSGTTIFYSSFENTNDLSQWYGVWLENLRSDTPNGGGKLSAYIAGYGIEPYAFTEVGSFNQDFTVSLRCRGKNMADGGVVSMYLKDDEEQIIKLAIESKEWTTYESAETLNLAKGKTLRLELNSAFTVDSAILIDMVEVFKIE